MTITGYIRLLCQQGTEAGPQEGEVFLSVPLPSRIQLTLNNSGIHTLLMFTWNIYHQSELILKIHLTLKEPKSVCTLSSHSRLREGLSPEGKSQYLAMI